MKPKLKILFICSQNKKRSPTAEEIYNQFPNLEARSAGLNKGAEYLLDFEDLLWADIVFVMEKAHLRTLGRKYSLYAKDKRIICLNIPDKFGFGEIGLVNILREKVDKYVL